MEEIEGKKVEYLGISGGIRTENGVKIPMAIVAMRLDVDESLACTHLFLDRPALLRLQDDIAYLLKYSPTLRKGEVLSQTIEELERTC